MFVLVHSLYTAAAVVDGVDGVNLTICLVIILLLTHDVLRYLHNFQAKEPTGTSMLAPTLKPGPSEL